VEDAPQLSPRPGFEIDNPEGFALAVRALATAHHDYRAAGQHGRADALAVVASILVMGRMGARRSGGAA